MKKWVTPVRASLVMAIVALSWSILKALSSETAGEVLFSGFRSAIAVFVGPSPQEISTWVPEAQGEFWLSRAGARSPDENADAEECAAIALILHRPCGGYVSHYVKRSTDAIHSVTGDLGIPVSVTLDSDSMGKAEDTFEDACFEECTAWARRAAELEPQNPERWQVLAMLQFRGTRNYFHPVPRCPEWKIHIETAEKHDSGNALYPLLLAFGNWAEGTALESSDRTGSSLPVIRSERAADAGWQQFQRAIKARKVDLPSSPSTVCRFLEAGGSDSLSATTFSMSYSLAEDIVGITAFISRRLIAFTEEAQLVGDYEQALRIAKHAVQFAQQIVEDPSLFSSHAIARHLHLASLLRIEQIAAVAPELTASDSNDMRRSERLQLRINEQVCTHADASIVRSGFRGKPVALIESSVNCILSGVMGGIGVVIVLLFCRLRHKTKTDHQPSIWHHAIWLLVAAAVGAAIAPLRLKIFCDEGEVESLGILRRLVDNAIPAVTPWFTWLIQWLSCGGPESTLLLWAMLCVIWVLKGTQPGPTVGAKADLRIRMTSLVSSLAGPGVLISTLLFCVGCWMFTVSLRDADKIFRIQRTYVMDPEQFVQQRQEAVRKIRSDSGLMARFETQSEAVEQRLATGAD
jgi:hypothetical protein